MLNMRNIKYLFLIGILGLFVGNGYSQNTDCKVTMASISGKYTGACRKGLANGHGTSEGVDSYTGSFKNGLPHGIGKYTWADGSSFEGHWNKGMKDGKGTMITTDSTYSGIWKDDVYIGKEFIPPYKVDRSWNVIKYSFFKSKSTFNVIRIRFFQGAVECGNLKSVDFGYNSGQLYHDGKLYGIQNPSFPIDIRIKFTALYSLGMVEFEANFDFTINEPGAWDLRISY
jgi:hypothetical protein